MGLLAKSLFIPVSFSGRIKQTDRQTHDLTRINLKKIINCENEKKNPVSFEY